MWCGFKLSESLRFLIGMVSLQNFSIAFFNFFFLSLASLFVSLKRFAFLSSFACLRPWVLLGEGLLPALERVSGVSSAVVTISDPVVKVVSSSDNAGLSCGSSVSVIERASIEEIVAGVLKAAEL